MTSGEKIKRRIFSIIQIGNKNDFASTLFDYIISLCIIVCIVITFMMTFSEFDSLDEIFKTIEFIIIIIFVIEYILRVWTSEYLYEGEKKSKAVFKFIFSFYGIVDLLTIVSFFAPLFSNGFIALRILRVVRIMRLFKLNAQYDAFNVITDVLKDKKDQIISSVFIIFVMLIMSSLCMYSLEHEAQPENFTNAFSGIWWAVSAMLTVGYGDIYPITLGGRIMAIVIAFLGVGLVAIPTGIISAGFVEYFTEIKTGTYSHRNAEFVAIDLTPNHSFINKKINELELPEGLYLAVVIRDDDIFTAYSAFELKTGDRLLLASTSNVKIQANVEEIKLDKGHPWIEQKITDLDISRRTFILLIRRADGIVKPEGKTVLLEGDTLVMLNH